MSRRCAIVGMDIIAALGVGAEAVWSEMMRKSCGIRPLTRFPRGKYATDFAAELPPEAEGMSGAYALAVGVGRRLLDGSAGAAARARTARTGLVLATTKAEIGEIERLALEPGADVTGRHNPYVLARDVAKELGLAGPVMAVSNACSSGLIAIVQAIRLLRRGAADMMVVIGVDVLADFILAGFSALNALSPRPCRPYDAGRDGLSLGEGAAALLLTLAPRQADVVLGVVAGWGIANDACHITAPSRTGDGLRAAVTRALAAANLSPGDIHYINGHGTATLYNDAMEAKALYGVFGDGDRMPPLSSLKGYLGHTLGAAGVIETVLCLMAMREKTVPACLGLERLGVERPLNVPREHLPLQRLTRVLSVKCGFGGINAALVLDGEAE